MNPLLLTDYYKTQHHLMYNPGTTLIYSNLTARKSRIKGVNSIVFFGLQYFILKYLIEEFDKNFFKKSLKEIIEEYKFAIDVDTSHIEALHKLGYLPIQIKALPEGCLVPIGVPCLTIKNTHPSFFWLTNYLETLLSCTIWQPITSATIGHEFRKLLDRYAIETTGTNSLVQWQGHDFSMRGMSSVESAISSGMAHLLSFTGTDTIPAIYALKKYYNAEGLIGASVPATEHSVMCLGSKDDEIETFKRLLDLYPSGILSIVSDTWDLWKVLIEYLPALKVQILARDGKLVIRPDSGDPVDIICGRFMHHVDGKTLIPCDDSSADKGVIQLLWDTFGGTVNKQGYKELNSHIGAIYGDSISLERAEQICERLKKKGFASTNIVFGIGSYTYQMNTRDTFGFAVKATYGEVKIGEKESLPPIPIIEGREIFKDPITDDGTKKSAKGLLQVVGYDYDGGEPSYGTKHPGFTLALRDQVSKEDEEKGYLETVFLDGKLTKHQTLSEIRERLLNQ